MQKSLHMGVRTYSLLYVHTVHLTVPACHTFQTTSCSFTLNCNSTIQTCAKNRLNLLSTKPAFKPQGVACLMDAKASKMRHSKHSHLQEIYIAFFFSFFPLFLFSFFFLVHFILLFVSSCNIAEKNIVKVMGIK